MIQLKNNVELTAFESISKHTTLRYDFNNSFAKVTTLRNNVPLVEATYYPVEDKDKYESVLRQINRLSA